MILARVERGFIKETFVEEEAIVNPFVNLSEFELFLKKKPYTKFQQNLYKRRPFAFFLLTISVSYATQDVLEILQHGCIWSSY